MTRLFFTIILLSLFVEVYSQDKKAEKVTPTTKLDAFSSKTGVVYKLMDYNLDDLKLMYAGSCKTRIRKISDGKLSEYFYQIEKSGQYSNTTASIAYSDLIEVIKAIQILKADVNVDINNNSDYLEHKFVTEDGFQIGYYIDKGKAVWYMKLERYGSDNTIFLRDSMDVDSILTLAKQKIELLKG